MSEGFSMWLCGTCFESGPGSQIPPEHMPCARRPVLGIGIGAVQAQLQAKDAEIAALKAEVERLGMTITKLAQPLREACDEMGADDTSWYDLAMHALSVAGPHP